MFPTSVGNLLIGAAISKGTEYVKNEYFQGSFLDRGLKSIGSSFGIDKFFGKDPVSQAALEVGKDLGGKVIEELLNQGLGFDPRTGQNMPTIDVPEGDTFRSKYDIQKAKNYGGLPQGSRRVIDNAFDDPVVENIAMKYTEARMPKMRVVEPTVRLSSLGALGKGQIKSTKI
jgi:hypothetical protein